MTTQSSRRAFLGVATALAAGSVANVTALVATRPSASAESLRPVLMPSEDAELIALGEQIAPLLATFHTARDHMQASVAAYYDMVPEVPAGLVHGPSARASWLRTFTREECDINGKPISLAKDKPPRRIYCSRMLRADLIIHDYCDERYTRQLKRLVTIAKRYEKGVKDALVRSGYDDRESDYRHAAYKLQDLVQAIRKAPPPKTLRGVLVIAEALQAYSGEAEIAAGSGRSAAAGLLGPELARAILTIGAIQRETAV